MTRVVSGDAGAVELLFARHRVSVLSVLRRLVGRPDLAEDLLQETFVRVWAHRARYRSSDRFRAWLYTIARNLVTDHRRRTGARPEELDEDAMLAASTADTGPHEWAVASDLAHRVDQALAALPEAAREVVLLARFGGMTAEEIATVTGSTPGAVRVALHRALHRLRTAVER